MGLLFSNKMSLEEKVRWGHVWREHGDPQKFLREKYGDLTRGQLWKKDRGLYNCLLKLGLLEPISKPRANFGDDPKAYYDEHHGGLTRGELKKENSSLYNRMWRDGLLEHVPLKR